MIIIVIYIVLSSQTSTDQPDSILISFDIGCAYFLYVNVKRTIVQIVHMMYKI